MEHWLVVSALEGASGAKVEELLRRQLEKWDAVTGGREFWWRLVTVPVPAAEGTKAQMEEARAAVELLVAQLSLDDERHPLNVLVLGDTRARATQCYFHTVPSVLRVASRPAYLPGRTVSVRGILVVPGRWADIAPEERGVIATFLTEVNTLMSALLAFRPFDSIDFLQETRETGYAERMMQLAFHVIHAPSPPPTEKPYHLAGAAALVRDRQSLAVALENQMVGGVRQLLLAATNPPFFAADQVAGDAEEITRDLAPRDVVKALCAGIRPYEMPSDYGGQARDRNGGHVSPYALFSKSFYRDYIHGYLRNLPSRLSEYGRILLHIRLGEIRETMREKAEKLWEVTEEHGPSGMMERARVVYGSILRGERGEGRNVPQVVAAAKRVAGHCRRAELKGLVEEELRKVQFFHVPESLRAVYDAAERRLLQPSEEAERYQVVKESVQGHPLPGALLVRSLIIGVMLALVVVPLSRLFGPFVPGLRDAERYPMLLRALAFSVPLAAAAWRYVIRGLRGVRKAIKQYVAAFLHHAEARIRDDARDKTLQLYERLAVYSDEVVAWGERLSTEVVVPEVTCPEYPVTACQFAVDLKGMLDANGFTSFENRRKVGILSSCMNGSYEGVRVCDIAAGTLPGSVPARNSSEIALALASVGRNLAADMHRNLATEPLAEVVTDEQRRLMSEAARPNARVAPAVSGTEVAIEWKHARTDRLPEIELPNGSPVTESNRSDDLASVAVFSGVSNLRDVAPIAELSMIVPNQDVSDTPRLQYCAALAEGFESQPQPLVCFLDGDRRIRIDWSVQAEIVRKALGR